MAEPRWHDAHRAIATFALPILKDYYIFKSGFPGALEAEVGFEEGAAEARWNEIILGIITAFEHINNEDWTHTDQTDIIDQEYLVLFGRWFTHLWD